MPVNSAPLEKWMEMAYDHDMEFAKCCFPVIKVGYPESPDSLDRKMNIGCKVNLFAKSKEGEWEILQYGISREIYPPIPRENEGVGWVAMALYYKARQVADLWIKKKRVPYGKRKLFGIIPFGKKYRKFMEIHYGVIG